jgi:hypothetical protein
VGDGDGGGGFEVGDGAGDLEDAVVGAGAEALLLHGALEEALGVGGQLAEGADLLGGHLGVSKDGSTWGAGRAFGADGGFEEAACWISRAARTRARISVEPSELAPPRSSLVLHGGDFDVDVDAVEQRAADLGDVTLDHRRGAHAFAGLVIEVAAGSRVISL